MEFIRFYLGIAMICFAVGSMFPSCHFDNLEQGFDTDRRAMKKDRRDFYRELQSTLDKDPTLARSMLVEQMLKDAKDIEECADGNCSYSLWGVDRPFSKESFTDARSWLAVMRNHPTLSNMPLGTLRLNWYGDSVIWDLKTSAGIPHFSEYDRDDFERVLALPPGEYIVSFLNSNDKDFYSNTFEIEENSETVIAPKVGVLHFGYSRKDLGLVKVSHHGALLHKEYQPRRVLLLPGHYLVESGDKKANVEIVHGHTTKVSMKDGSSTIEKHD